MDITDKTVSFDDIIINFRDHRITWKGEEQSLPGSNPWELLKILICESPRLVCYEEISKELWRERNSNDEKLRKNIQGIIIKIRKAIHDDAVFPKYVVPTPGKGYTFAVRYNILDAPVVIPEMADSPKAYEPGSITVTWIDGTPKSIAVYRELNDEKSGRKYYQFVCDKKRYCVQVKKNSAGRDNWRLVPIADWIDLATELRKKQLNSQILSLEDCDRSVYEFASRQKEQMDQVLVKYPLLTIFFDGKASAMPADAQKEMCFSLAMIIGSYLQAVEPVLNHLPYYYACSILDWQQKVLSSPIMETVVPLCPWFWEFII